MLVPVSFPIASCIFVCDLTVKSITKASDECHNQNNRGATALFKRRFAIERVPGKAMQMVRSNFFYLGTQPVTLPRSSARDLHGSGVPLK